MAKLKMFCITMSPEHGELIKEVNYEPVGLGEKKFPKYFYTDKTGESISSKNPFYGEYTFHYWLWKNYLNKIKTDWVGFCQYRKFFVKKKIDQQNIDFQTFQSLIIKEIENEDKKYECILGKKFSVENYKISKIFKNHLFSFLKEPNLFINKKKRNLRLHFDLFHGKGNLSKAINLLEKSHQEDFRNYMENNNAFNPHNMFICKTHLLNQYYEIIFPWLKRCESLFGFLNSPEYGRQRIYGFLAERFMSYWFNKNFKIKEISILGKDLSDYRNL